MAGALEVQPHFMAEAKGLASRLSFRIPDALSTLPSVAKEKVLPWVFRGALATGTALTGTAGIDHVSRLRPHVASAQDTQGEIAMTGGSNTEAAIPDAFVRYTCENENLPYSTLYPFGWSVQTEIQNNRAVDVITGGTFHEVVSKGEIFILPTFVDPNTGEEVALEQYGQLFAKEYIEKGATVGSPHAITIDGSAAQTLDIMMSTISDGSTPIVSVNITYFLATNPATGKQEVWFTRFTTADGEDMQKYYRSRDYLDTYPEPS